MSARRARPPIPDPGNAARCGDGGWRCGMLGDPVLALVVRLLVLLVVLMLLAAIVRGTRRR
jgi:hypothetical protein